MTLSKKHFEAVAEILGQHDVSQNLVKAFAEYFRSENGLFDRGRFMAAVDKHRPE